MNKTLIRILCAYVWIGVIHSSAWGQLAIKSVELQCLELRNKQDTTKLNQVLDLLTKLSKDTVSTKKCLNCDSCLYFIEYSVSDYDSEKDQLTIYSNCHQNIPTKFIKNIIGYVVYKNCSFLVLGKNSRKLFDVSRNSVACMMQIIVQEDIDCLEWQKQNKISSFGYRNRPNYRYIPFLVTRPDYIDIMQQIYGLFNETYMRWRPSSNVVAIKIEKNKSNNCYHVFIGFTSMNPENIHDSDKLILDNNKDLYGFIKYKDMRCLVFGRDAKVFFQVFPIKRYIRARIVGSQERTGIFDGGIYWEKKGYIQNDLSYELTSQNR